MSEYAPPPPKIRVTKAQLRKKQEEYQRAAALAEDNSKQEAQEKKAEIQKLEEKIKNVF
jgi:hypothetical protein